MAVDTADARISDNCFALRGQSPNLIADEFLQIGFTPDEEFPADTRELMRPAFRHVEGELPDKLFAHEFDFDFCAHGFPFIKMRPSQ